MASPPITSSPFPYAPAPDIIRAHQKDVYFQGLLTTQLADLHRRLLGARSAHAWANESRTAADLLYLCLTTLLGNRTLGEEYCDLVQVEEGPSGPATRPGPAAPASSGDEKATGETGGGGGGSVVAVTGGGGPRLPSLRRRAAYIALSTVLPYLFSRLLPSLRARLRRRLEARLAELQRRAKAKGRDARDGAGYRARRYLLAHLAGVTSGAHVQAAVLATFYFTGAFYSLPKRLTRLRYVFTRRLPGQPGAATPEGRAGYEVLGVLLVLQLAVQGYLHARAALRGSGAEEAAVEAAARERAFGPGHPAADVSLNHEHSYGSGNNDLLLHTSSATATAAATTTTTTPPGGQRSKAAIGAMTHTPVAGGGGDSPVYDLRDGGVMGWVRGRAQRNCTLCLEELKDPSATPCGHVFCWACIGDWVREKPECPLCRREALVQHILPLRVAAC